MKVDRSLFLVLAGALAAGGCLVKEYQPPAPPPPAPPPAPVANNSSPTPPPAPGQPAPHLQPLHEENGKGGTPTPFHFGPIKPQPGPAPTPQPTPAPSACLDSGATQAPAVCNPSMCPSNPFAKTRCTTYAQYFDAKVGAAAVNCLNGLNTSTCDSQHAYDCGKSALAQACPDQTVGQLCQIAASACKANQNDCVAMFSGLNSNGQDAVAQCVAGGCNGGNLYSCIEGLGSTSAHH
ncbi:MAG TPA: hypothetical protein VF765_36655 [Polyangiaceae bacterium]